MTTSPAERDPQTLTDAERDAVMFSIQAWRAGRGTEPIMAAVERTLADRLSARPAATTEPAVAAELDAMAAELQHLHDMPPNKDSRKYDYRMGWWDGVHHAAKVLGKRSNALVPPPAGGYANRRLWLNALVRGEAATTDTASQVEAVRALHTRRATPIYDFDCFEGLCDHWPDGWEPDGSEVAPSPACPARADAVCGHCADQTLPGEAWEHAVRPDAHWPCATIRALDPGTRTAHHGEGT